jgi:muramoyltetrapeptide carboxypeptidase
LLEGAGFRVSFGAHAFASDGYLAGPDADRAADLTEAFCDPDVHAVVCSRGGYGCARLLAHLDLDAIAASGKLFVGFSDVTTLHLALNRRGLATVHGPMLVTFSVERPAWVAESWLSTMRGVPGPMPDVVGTCVTGGVAEGQLVGGCLCLLADSLGTSEALEAAGRVLLIEDVDEPPHRVDAMLTHLIRAGVVQRAAGIVVGEMTRTDERADGGIGRRPWREIVDERLGDLGVPLIRDYPCGHAPAPLTLPLGTRVRLDADAGTLSILESPCD